MNELLLRKKMALVAKYGIQPEDVAILIDENPVINTLKEGDRLSLLSADLLIDEEDPSHVEKIINANHIIYWKLKDQKSSVKITGIAWMRNGEITLFSGGILAP